MADRDYESEAREQGWKPKEEFSGPEDKWTDAKTFVEKGEKIAGILKSRIDRLEHRLSAAESANKEFGEYTKAQRDKAKQESQARISELEAQLAQAVTDGDGQEFARLNGEISRERNSQQAQPEGPSDYDKLSQAWLRDNQWYTTDQDLAIYADGIAERVANEGYQGQAYFKELTERVKARFPDKFDNPRRDGANSVDAGGELETEGSETAHTYDNLPKDAKAACDRFVKQGLTSKEDYVANYEWE